MNKDLKSKMMDIFAQAKAQTDKSTTPTFGTDKPAPAKRSKKPELSTMKVDDLIQPQATDKPVEPVRIVPYSDKAFAVIGDTKPIKDTLKGLGGKFNPYLKCGAGWIFNLKKLDDVQKTLNLKIDQS